MTDVKRESTWANRHLDADRGYGTWSNVRTRVEVWSTQGHRNVERGLVEHGGLTSFQSDAHWSVQRAMGGLAQALRLLLEINAKGG